jgi:uncharacterized Rossmann fold enzyme
LKGFELAGDWNFWRVMAHHGVYYQYESPLGAFRRRVGQLSVERIGDYRAEIERVVPLEVRRGRFEELYREQEWDANVIRSDDGSGRMVVGVESVREVYQKVGERLSVESPSAVKTELDQGSISDMLQRSQEKIRQFHNKHLGQRCVIIGNGPSLNEMDLSFLRHEICFGMNKIYLGFERWNFSPTYYVAVNEFVIEQSVDGIRKMSCPKFIGNRGISSFNPTDDIIFMKTFPPPGEAFSKCPDMGLEEGATVTYVAMQLAYYMGFSEVVLIGVDHHFVTQGTPHKTVVSDGDDPNHFDPSYFGQGLKWQLPDLEGSEKSYRIAKQVFEESGRRIIDATVNGRCQVFPKENYREIFNINLHTTINSYQQQNKNDITSHIDESGGIPITFGIKTNRKNELKTIAVIFSILSQNIAPDKFEIIVTGDTKFRFIPKIVSENYQIRLIEDLDAANNGKLATMMNTILREAAYTYVCSCDDDIIFTDGWYKKLCDFFVQNPQAKVISFPIKNTDGSRFWDWACNDEKLGSILANLGENGEKTYVTGGMVVLHKEVWRKVKWDESKGFYEKEDVDWSQRIRQEGYNIQFCLHASVLHNDWRYFQKGIKVVKTQKMEEVLSHIPTAFQSFGSHSNSQYLSIEEKGHWPLHLEKIKGLKDKYKGKRCFIIGNGPSLNLHDLNFLKSEITFGVNGIFYKTDETGFRPTFYLVEDKAVIRDNVERINSYEGVIKILPTDYYDQIIEKDKVIWFRMNQGYYEGKSPYFCVPRFSTDCSERVYCGQTVTYINLQLAYYMGFTEVYMIGMDFSYKVPSSTIINGGVYLSTEDDPNHFHPEYFGKGKTWHNPRLDRVERSYLMAKLVYEGTGRKIYNATCGGKLELFERVDYYAIFGMTSSVPQKAKDNFDEDMYLTLYPDVRSLIERDKSYTPFLHYVKHGKYEDRIMPLKLNKDAL